MKWGYGAAAAVKIKIHGLSPPLSRRCRLIHSRNIPVSKMVQFNSYFHSQPRRAPREFEYVAAAVMFVCNNLGSKSLLPAGGQTAAR